MRILCDFIRMPRKVVRGFAKLVDGEVLRQYRDLTRVVIGNEEVSGKCRMIIVFRADRPKKDIIPRDSILICLDEEAGMRIYKKPKSRANNTIEWHSYVALLQEPLTPLQAYKAYRICENLTYAFAKDAGFWREDEV